MGGRGVRAVGVATVGGLLALGPWSVALVPLLDRPSSEPTTPVRVEVSQGAAFGAPPPAAAARTGGCGCEDVVVNATNVVRDSRIRSGDAKVVNVNLTHISVGYLEAFAGDTEVKIKQRARARTGDALAGQTVGVAGSSPRCLNVIVRATNIVEDTQVRSGDATAVNRNIVLLDPGIDRGALELDLKQRARAHTGQASAGQIIGVTADTAGRCGRGSVTIEAVDRGSNVEVRTGDAKAENRNSIITCDEVGCADELARYLHGVESVLVCTSSGCRQKGASELAAELGIELTRRPPEPPPGVEAPRPGPDLDRRLPEPGPLRTPRPVRPPDEEDDGRKTEPGDPDPEEPEDLDPEPDGEEEESDGEEDPEAASPPPDQGGPSPTPRSA